MNYKFELLEKVDKSEWNRRVESLAEGTLFQTTHKAELCQKTLKQKPLFLIGKRNGRVIAQALILTGFISPKAILGKPFLRAALPIATNLFNVYSIFYGPLIFDKTNYGEILDNVLDFIDEEFRKKHYTLGNIIPPIHNMDKGLQRFGHIFESNGFFAETSGTVLIDLKQDISKLWKDLGHRSRYDVRKTERQDVEIVEAKTKDEVIEYHNMRVEAAKRSRIRIPLLANTMVGWGMLGPLGKVKIFLAKLKGKIISGLLISEFNGIIFESGVANSNYGLKSKIRGAHLLKWHIINWAHQNKFHIYDLAGINPDPEIRSPKEEGIYQFKSRWGGILVKFSTYAKTYSPLKIKTVKACKRVLG